MTQAQKTDLRETIARALWEELNVPKGRNWDDHAVSAARIYWNDRAAVMLAIARPAIIEECAEVADARCVSGDIDTSKWDAADIDYEQGGHEAARYLAAAIRALAEKP